MAETPSSDPRATRSQLAILELPRTTCDGCRLDYARDPNLVGTVLIPSHPLYWRTICLACIGELGIIGRPDPLGTQTPPPSWPHPIPCREKIAEWQWTGECRIEREEDATRLDVEGELLRIVEKWSRRDLGDDSAS